MKRNAQAALGTRHIPAHEIAGIVDVIAFRTPAAGGTAVFVPGAVDGLGIAVGRAHSAHRKHAQHIAIWRARTGFEFAFLIDHRHLDMGRDPPAAFGIAERAGVMWALS